MNIYQETTKKMTNAETYANLHFSLGYAETLLALLKLEYHDKNYLLHGGNPKKLCESEIELIELIINNLKRLQGKLK